MFKPAERGQPSHFARDSRFWPVAAQQEPAAGPVPEPAEEPVDPLEQARADGYRAGREDALVEAARETDAIFESLEAFALSFARLDTAEEARLATALRETVEALCHALIADVALDPAALVRRAEAAARLLARAEDERTFRLNPEDIAMVGGHLPADWTVVPDPALERGAIRVETPGGGVEDGPGAWRCAIAEALRTC